MPDRAGEYYGSYCLAELFCGSEPALTWNALQLIIFSEYFVSRKSLISPCTLGTRAHIAKDFFTLTSKKTLTLRKYSEHYPIIHFLICSYHLSNTVLPNEVIVIKTVI